MTDFQIDPTLALDTFGNHDDGHIAGRWSMELEQRRLAMSRLPRGFITEATVTADQNTITAAVDLTGLSITFTAAADRRYRVEGEAHFIGSGAAVQGILRLSTGTSGAGTTLRESNKVYGTATHDHDTLAHHVVPGDGTVSYHLRAQSSGTMNMIANSARYAVIRAYDVGPST